MSCGEAVDRLSAHLDAELQAGEARALDDHLATCAACRRRLSVLATTRDAVQVLPRESVSAGFEARLHRRLALETVGSPMAAEDPGPLPRRPRSRWAALATVVATVGVLFGLVFHGRRETPPPSTRASLAVPSTPVPAAADCSLVSVGPGCQVERPCLDARTCGIPVSALEEAPAAAAR
jgi:anti-sigma factor RsiW